MKNKIILLLTSLFMAIISMNAQQQVQKVTGKVTDYKTGEALIGVNITIKGSTNAAISDINGDFSINVPNLETSVMKFTYMGYETQEILVKNRTGINVQLKELSHEIGEAVVVGYGVQRKESVIGSISSISNKTLVSVPVSNISQSLAGKLPGVQVVQSSGEIGGDVADVYIRGMSTWNNATPLYVIDGIVRNEYAKIDPNEIENINILKDASATAVYGVKGANGVIIITTKRGSLGKPKVSFTAQNALTEPINIPQPLNAYDTQNLLYLQDWGGYRTRTAQTSRGLAYDLMMWRTGASPWTHPDIDWVDETMKKFSSQQQYNVNVSGGTKNVKYFVSGGYINQNGFYKNDPYTKYSRFNFRSNLDVDVTENLSASLNIGSRVENLNSPNNTIWNSWGVYRGAFGNSGRIYPIYNPDGSYAGDGSTDLGGANLVKMLKESAIYKDVTSTLESSLSINYKLDFITKGLSLRAMASFDNQGETGRSWSRSTAEYVYDLESDTYQKFGEDLPLSYNGVQKNYNWYKIYLEAGMNYNRTFGKNSVTGLFLANRNKRIRNDLVPFADQGLVGRVTYDFDKRYFGEINVGYNGSENFPKGSQYGFFPAFAAGWMISNEDFIANSSLSRIISTLKLRASLGWVGNDKTGTDPDLISNRFLFLQEYNNAGGYTFGIGDNYYNGIQQGDIANKAVSWEVARKENIGIESNFFNGLFGIDFDYFYEYRNKILTDINNINPAYVGATFKVANVGETTNHGFELSLRHNMKINRDFSYFINANVSYNRNKVLKKADKEGLLPYQKEEGYPIGTTLMWKCLGYFTSYEEIQNSPSQLTYHNGLPSNVEIVPGDLKFLDFNNDGVINQDDAFRQGYGSVPEIQYGITLGSTVKAFDFSILFQGSTHAQFPKNWEIMWAFSNNDNVFEKHQYYWAPEIADAAQFTRFYGKSWVNNERYYSTYEIGSGTYLRIKNVEFGYTLPSRIIQKALITSARVYLSSVNTYMWAAEKYLDPDNRNNRGGFMPPTRNFNIGVNINF